MFTGCSFCFGLVHFAVNIPCVFEEYSEKYQHTWPKDYEIQARRVEIVLGTRQVPHCNTGTVYLNPNFGSSVHRFFEGCLGDGWAYKKEGMDLIRFASIENNITLQAPT